MIIEKWVCNVDGDEMDKTDKYYKVMLKKAIEQQNNN